MPFMQLMGPLMIDIPGQSLSSEDIELLNHPLVGGIIFFARNYASKSQFKDLTCEISSSVKKPLLMAVDQEGGRVQRFKSGFTELPAPGKVLEWHQQQKDAPAIELLLSDIGWLMASEVLSVGVDISFAPVLDINFGVSQVIGDRAFASDPETIIQNASAYILGMQEAGMPATGKHFPGHGFVSEDSHVELPIDGRTWKEILKQDGKVFDYFCKKQIPALMMAHIVFSKVAHEPVGFSTHWVNTILRKELRYQGVIFSDDLSMEGASCMGSICDRARISLEAGCDMILVCNHREGATEVIDKLQFSPKLSSSERLSKLLSPHKYDERFLENTRCAQIKSWIERINQE